MKNHILTIVLVLLSLASPVAADRLMIFSNAALTNYTVDDTAPRIVNLYVTGYLFESTGVRFSVKPGPGFTGVWLGDTSSFVPVGQSPTDIAIGFGACVTTSSFVVLTMSYQLFGTSSSCSELRVAPADGFSYAESTGYCGFDLTPLQLGKLYANCPNPPQPPVATEPTTWGRVKALYRD